MYDPHRRLLQPSLGYRGFRRDFGLQRRAADEAVPWGYLASVVHRDPYTLPLFGSDGDDPAPTARSSSRGPAQSTPASADLRALGQRLPAALRLGTSSWSFPGWSQLVYDRELSEQTLARTGLLAYARHPLFRSVGVDKTYYRPAPTQEFARLAAQVPEDFRFLVKAWRAVVDPEPVHGRGAFLDARVAETECVRPVIEGLGERAGPILFQFPPMQLAGAVAVRGFLERLRGFLQALPRGPLYAVEVRNRALVGPLLGELLAEAGVAPCLTVHPTMPGVEEQSRELALDPSRPLVMRWMLRANHRYEEAKDLYAPFDRIVEPDDTSRDALARLARAALAAGLGVWVIVNNKAEGSSPLSVERLARQIVD